MQGRRHDGQGEGNGHPLGGYPHMAHWHGPGHDVDERVPSVEPRRWPEGTHAPWEEPAWWEREGAPIRSGRWSRGLRRLVGGLPRGPHVGKGPKGYRRTDDRIREDACDRIMHWGWVDARDVEVEVEAGEVTLCGPVASRRDKRALEDLVETVAGVRDVHNRLRVRRGER